MKSAVVVFPGINRERDMARTLKLVSGREPAMLWHADTALPAGTDLVVIPGGFSYGDYLRCGAIAARSPIMEAVKEFAAEGGLVLGVCNGFQILCEAGAAAGRADAQPESALHLPRCLSAGGAFRHALHPRLQRRPGDPRAGGAWRGQLHRRQRNHRQAGRRGARAVPLFARPTGMLDPNWNHNGAINGIAGILNERGNVLGMMPHPENHVEASIGSTEGRGLFAGLVEHLAKAA